MQNKKDVQVSLLGPSAAGKTSLIHFLINGILPEKVYFTTGSDFKYYQFQKNKTLMLRDNAGQQRYRNIIWTINKKAKVFIFIFDLSDGNSFSQIKQWLQQFQQRVDMQKVIFYAFGNKADLPRQIEKDFIESFWAVKGIQYNEISLVNSGNTKKQLNECYLKFGTNVHISNYRNKKKIKKASYCKHQIGAQQSQKENVVDQLINIEPRNYLYQQHLYFNVYFMQRNFTSFIDQKSLFIFISFHLIKNRMSQNKIVHVSLLGPSGVGKSSLIQFLCQGQNINPFIEPTLGVNYKRYQFQQNKTVQLWDNAGQQKYRKMLWELNKRFKAFIFIFDLSCGYSFSQIQQWLGQFEEKIGMQKVIFYAFGNKADLPREIEKDFIENFWAQKGIQYNEISLINSGNTKKIIDRVLSEIWYKSAYLELQLQKNRSKSIMLKAPKGDKQVNGKRKCC